MPQPIPTASREPGANLTHGTPTDHPRNAHGSPTERTRNAHGSPTERPHPAHFAALRRTSPKPSRQGAAHFAGEVGCSIYILPRLGEVSAMCSARCPPLRTSPAAHGEVQGGRTVGGTEEDGGGRQQTRGDGRPADGQTDRPADPIKEKAGVVYIIRSLHNPARVACSIGRARPSPASSRSSSPARRLVEGDRRRGERGER